MRFGFRIAGVFTLVTEIHSKINFFIHLETECRYENKTIKEGETFVIPTKSQLQPQFVCQKKKIPQKYNVGYRFKS